MCKPRMCRHTRLSKGCYLTRFLPNRTLECVYTEPSCSLFAQRSSPRRTTVSPFVAEVVLDHGAWALQVADVFLGLAKALPKTAPADDSSKLIIGGKLEGEDSDAGCC